MKVRHRFERFAARAFLSALLVGAALGAMTGAAAAAGLFDTATSTEMSVATPSRSTQGSLRNRVVRLNTSELAAIVPAGADTAADRLQRARNLSGAVTLDLFPGVSVTAQRTDVETPEEGGYVWIGRAGGDRPAWVTLVINNNEIVGHIQTGGKVYSIEPVSGALHRIIEVNQDRILDDMHIDLPAGVPQKRSDATEPSLAADPRVATTIKVLVGHTINARAEVGTSTQMQQRINLAISLANQAFTNSAVMIQYQRVGGANEINYNEAAVYGGLNGSNNYVNVLCDVSNIACTGNTVANRNKFGALRTKRNTVAADLVVLMRKQGTACGIAWVPDPPSAGTNIYGFSVTTSTPGGIYNCVEGNTLAHETGHNMGLHHDRAQHISEGNPNPPPSKFNFGHVNTPKRFFTIMAYRSRCNGGSGCTRAPHFSNPGKTFNAGFGPAATGIPQGTAGAADAHKTLNVTRAAVGSYR